MTKRKNNDSNNTNPNESSNSDFTDLIFQLQIEKYHSLISILSELRTKAGIFLAMLGVIASIGFSFSAYGVVSQYINNATAIQILNSGGVLGSGNGNLTLNNVISQNNTIISTASINQTFTDGLTTLQTNLNIVLVILLIGLIIITVSYVYLLNKSFKIKDILLPLSENIILIQNAQDKSGRERPKIDYQKKVINQLNIRISELEEIVSFFKNQFIILDILVIAFCVIGISAIMCMNFDQIGFNIAVGLVSVMSIFALLIFVIGVWINVIRPKNMMKEWIDSKY